MQSPSWEADWFAASQVIPRISRNPKVHYRTHKRPPPVPSWASPIQSIYPHPTSWRSILILFIHLHQGLPSGLFPSGFPSKPLYTPSPHPYASHAQPISFVSILSPAQYWVRSTDHLVPTNIKFSPKDPTNICQNIYKGDRGSTVVKVLCYKSEGRWFDPRWCHWNF